VRDRRWRLAATGLVAAVLVPACSNAPQTVLEPMGEYARKADRLWKLTFIIAVGVFVLVQGLVIAAILKFRAKPGDDSLPVQVHGNPRLEVIWTIIPALILAGIAVPTVQTIFDVARKPEGALTIEVIGHRWWWEYRYPDERIVTANELHIPAGQPIHLELTALEAGGTTDAVIHSFWVPALGGKQDVVPGRVNTLNLEADEPGTYIGQCAEYCGLSHANMRLRVVAHTPSDFEAWVAQQQGPAGEPDPGSLAAEGRDVFMGSACVGCHAIAGTDARGNVGPDLTHFASRQVFAGAIFETNRENLQRWLEDPPAMKPMHPEANPAIGMPDLGLSPAEIDALTEFLLSLR